MTRNVPNRASCEDTIRTYLFLSLGRRVRKSHLPRQAWIDHCQTLVDALSNAVHHGVDAARHMPAIRIVNTKCIVA